MKYLGTKTIETERLILRRLTINDAKAAYENWCSSLTVSKYVMWKIHKNIEETEELFKLWESEYEKDNTFRWIVEIKDDHELIGTIDVSKKLIEYGSCEIGYCYGEKFWGKGYATEALKAVIKYLFEECDADLINAEHLINNPASGKVMQKSGMIYEATLKSRIIDKDGIRNDLVSYYITKDMYKNKKEEM